MDYEYIIIGGGIAGLYCAYKLTQKYPSSKIMICEKESDLGGRIHTYYEKDFYLECGAGRFNSKHTNLIKLIDELGLKQKMKTISSNFVYSDIKQKDKSFLFKKTPDNVLLSRTSILIAEIIAYSKIFTEKDLQSISFIDFAKKVLKKDDINYIKSSFGYYTELVIMNAKDAIQLIMENLNPSLDFFVLDGGFSQIIENLRKILGSQKTVKILKNSEINKIECNSGIINVYSNTTKITCKKCICAIPSQELRKIPIFEPLHGILNKIKCSPLCRIYSSFREPWFSNLPKFSTNNKLRIVIPGKIGKTNTIMMSYTDNKFAEFWLDLYKKDKGKNDLINRELAKLMKESTDLDVPEPLNTYFFYWPCGVGYWGVGADSSQISKKIIQPFIGKELFVCGEHFSEKNQQWMEGALDTAENVLEKI